MNNLPLIIDALDFAAHAHRDQRRKGADATPYIAHPIALARILTVEGGVEDPIVIAAALLHDTVEDCGVLPSHLAQRFGQEVAEVVMEVTDDKALPKARRKELQVEHAASISPRAKLVKLADKIANVRDVGQNAPADWSEERRHEYAHWAARVVAGLRGTHPELEAAFDDAHATVVGRVPAAAADQRANRATPDDS
jgi:GTP diphosphokinase / guanosine-3',5'-bis(diphosphate) 3'-diphosphatase